MSAATLATIWRGVVLTAITAACAIIAFAPSPGWAMQEHDAHLHFAAFVVITLLAVSAFPRIPLSHMLVGLALLGVATELLQFAPGLGRQPDWADFGFNLLGIDCALILAALLRRRQPGVRAGLTPRTTTTADRPGAEPPSGDKPSDDPASGSPH